jgi:hypothetical protein
MARGPSPARKPDSAGLLRFAENVSTPLGFFVMVVVVLAGGCFGAGSVIQKNNGWIWILYSGGLLIILVIVVVVSYLIATNRSWELYGRNPLEETLARNLAVTIFESIDGYLGNLPEQEQIEAYAELALAMELGLAGEQSTVKKFRHQLFISLLSRLRQRNRTRAELVQSRVTQLVEEQRAATGGSA